MGNTKRLIPGKPLKNHTPYQKQKKRKKCRHLTAMELLMGPQNRTSHGRKRSDGRPIANDQCLYGSDRVALKEIHGTVSPGCSFLLFQRGFIVSSKNSDHQNNLTTTSKKDFLRSDYLGIISKN
ncbi:MAG: hypothetical protein OXC61_05190 [Flavobacteriaceae bacterium]|nr:hypothetical protein [Flavobacteriaceae bacterium]